MKGTPCYPRHPAKFVYWIVTEELLAACKANVHVLGLQTELKKDEAGIYLIRSGHWGTTHMDIGDYIVKDTSSGEVQGLCKESFERCYRTT